MFDKDKLVGFGVMVSRRLKDKVETKARKMDCSKSTIIRAALAVFFDRRKYEGEDDAIEDEIKRGK